MRRRLAVLWITLAVMGLAVFAAPPAVAADPSNQFLWVATTTQTLVYDRTTVPPTLVASHDDGPTGSFVRATRWVRTSSMPPPRAVSTCSTRRPGSTCTGWAATLVDTPSSRGYPTAASSTRYARTARSSTSSLTTASCSTPSSCRARRPTCRTPGRRTATSSCRAASSTPARTTTAAPINTADDSLTFFNAGTTHVANGTCGSNDRLRLRLDDDPGLRHRVDRPLRASRPADYTPTTGFTPRQVVISADGTQLFVPATDALGGAGVRVLDAGTLAQVAAFGYDTDPSVGIPAVAPDGMLYLASGANAPFASVGIYDTAGGGGIFDPLVFDNTQCWGSSSPPRPRRWRRPVVRTRRCTWARVFDDPVVATVVDAAGKPVPNQPVQWTVTPAGAATLQGCFLCYARTGMTGRSRRRSSSRDRPREHHGRRDTGRGSSGATSATFPLTILPPRCRRRSRR